MKYSVSDLWSIACAYLRGFFMVRIFEIEDNLYQSGRLDGWLSWLALKNTGIKGVVDLEGDEDPMKIREPLDWYHYWHIFDSNISTVDIDELWRVANTIQHKTQNGMRVLVHCQGGCNRSSLVNGCVLYLRGYKGQDIVDRIRRRRPGALTNVEFANYLKSLA